MKSLQIILILSAVIISLASANGVAEEQNKDRTGSPDGSNTCGQCHMGGSYNPDLSIELQDMNEIPVSSYIPGQQYRMLFSINAFFPFPDVYGFQATALLNDLADAGEFSNPSSNAQLEEVNTVTIPSRHVVEHSSPSFIGNFSVDWTAPAEGSGQVSIYASALAGNGNDEPEGDNHTSRILLVQEASPDGIRDWIENKWEMRQSSSEIILHHPSISVLESYEIYSMNGALEMTAQLEHTPIRINSEKLASGMHIIHLKHKGESIFIKALTAR